MSVFLAGSGSYTFVASPTLNPANVTANSISTETFTVTGVVPEFQYRTDCPTLEAGLFIVGSICTAKNVLTLSIWNTTNADINPASQVFRVLGF